jgi:DNA polymerase-3 subunit alpha
LGITDVDPIRFNLLFERFINPSRIDLPDADLDFMTSRRHEVIEYIVNTYGQDRVATISNYTSLGAASAIRDVSRLHGLPPFEYACSKQVEKEHGVSLSLEESAESVPDIAKFKAERAEIWKHATRLEGNMRGLGQHAAGVIVAGEPIVNRAFVETRSDRRVVNWDKNTVEDWGLIKMDILGLSTLDVMKKAAEYIEERHDTEIDFLRIPLNEPDIMDAFGKGDTTGIFQFESSGMRRLLKDLAVSARLSFDDISAVTALYRPGPLDAGMVDEFVSVKQGKKEAFYEHPAMKVALTETYGVLTYQEQIMQVCRDLAGFTLVDADHVRKAMGKKDLEKMKGYKEQFILGAAASGMAETAAGLLWDKIEGFAGYCFNKSHSVEYSIISYWAMFLKVRYPHEFFAASMSVVDDNDKMGLLVLDARRCGLQIVPPDINLSSDRIEIDGDKLLAPFQSIKGISANTAAYIMQAKEAIKAGVYEETMLDGVSAGRVTIVEPARGFTSQKHFEDTLTALKIKGKCNIKHCGNMERVGVFASVTAGAIPAAHPDRLKDRIELMPGFTVDSVKADRGINAETEAITQILRVISDYRACDQCEFKGKMHPKPTIGKRPTFMMVFDSPNWKEEKAGRMLEGDSALYLREALKDVGLNANDGYFTALVKAAKPGDMKMIPTDTIVKCSGFIDREIAILKPPIIVAMGSNSIRKFAPGVKGSPAELAGKVIYDPKLDASIVFGFNLAQLVYDLGKVKLLQNICQKISELVE